MSHPLQWMRDLETEKLFHRSGEPGKGYYLIEGLNLDEKWVNIAGKNERKCSEAEMIVEEAIAKGQTGKWLGYRLVKVGTPFKPDKKSKKVIEVADVKKILDETTVEKLEKFKEEKEMAKKNGGPAKRILGFREGTAIGDMATLLQDEKPHKLSTLIDRIEKEHKVDFNFRVRIMKKNGAAWKTVAGVIVDRDADTIQIKKGPNADKEISRGVVKKPKKNGNGDMEASAVAKLVRKTLTSGADWTRNKIVETLKKDHNIAPKTTEAAISAELDAGGLVNDKGIITLASA